MQPRPASARRKQTQGGFILLIIFLMAGAIALMLYAQLPRVAFESEREKEQILIDRGEQFIRAIQLYQLDNAGQWPQTLDDLEKKNNKRYLRRRYKDPFTGKDEWRLIHTNGGQLTDSLITKPPLADGSSATSSASNTTQPQEQQVNAAVGLRPSDVTLPGNQSFIAQSFPGQTPGLPPNGVPAQPQQGFGIPGVVQANGMPQLSALPGAGGAFQPQFPGQQFPGQQPPPGTQVAPGGFQPQFPGQQFPGQQPPPGTQVAPGGFQPQFPGQQLPGQQFPGQQQGAGGATPPVGFQFGPNGQLIPAPIGQPAPGSLPGAGTPGLPGGAGNAGIDVINRLLTTPRTPPAGLGTPQNNAVGGGIAGVASTHTGASIKVYNERSKYEEWEFVYTPQQGGAGGIGGAAGAGGQAGGRGGQGGQGGAPGATGGRGGQGGTNPTGPGGGFGGGFGGSAPGGFGGGPGGFGGGPGVGGGGAPGAPPAPGAGRGR